ncbi:ORF3 [Rodent Torque teno virus 2]|uniref:ORF3 n=1 Tax=Rodent Torque teno virus 2 TaxID=1514665 RepID=UPI000559BA36|nr:ORF3 [Rodent Torque teno virus 2]AJA32110.1 ORF3 [Rodent Torque teno virus 2]
MTRGASSQTKLLQDLLNLLYPTQEKNTKERGCGVITKKKKNPKKEGTSPNQTRPTSKLRPRQRDRRPRKRRRAPRGWDTEEESEVSSEFSGSSESDDL